MATELNLTVDDLDLDLDLIPPPARGRRAAPLVCGFERDLNESDILILIENPFRDIQTPSIQKLRHAHHQLARLLAEGVSNAETALITGYSPSRISILQNDPAFCELISYYAGMTKQVYVNVHERLAALGMNAMEELAERLEVTPETFTNDELGKLMERVFDRAGYGPKSTLVHENKDGMGEILAAIKKEVEAKRNGSIKTLDARPIQSPSSSHYSADPGSAEALGPAIDYSDFEDEGSESRGAAVRTEARNLPGSNVIEIGRAG